MPNNDFIGKDTDEMYTQYTDIVNELDHYPEELFRGKKILFPCDWVPFTIVATRYNLKRTTK